MDLAILLAAFPLRSFDFEEQNHYPKDAVFHPKSSEQYGQVREPPAKPGAKLNVPYHPLQLGTLPPHVPSEPRSASPPPPRRSPAQASFPTSLRAKSKTGQPLLPTKKKEAYRNASRD